MTNVIEIENLSKVYRLGEYGTGTLTHDLNRWWAKLHGEDDVYEMIDGKKITDSKYLKALQNININIQPGEILGIIGRNGAGKSTLLKIISRITTPTTGIIRARGKIAALLEVGTGMHPEMTARENIYLNGVILGMNRAEIKKKFDAIVDYSGCENFVDTPIKRFSSGMRVRLGFAVAAFLESDILIVDEVLAVGDMEFHKRAIGTMKEVTSENGRTVLFVSHNLAAVQAMCNRAILLENGKLKESGNVDSVIQKYRTDTFSLSDIDLIHRSDRSGSGLLKFSRFNYCVNNIPENDFAITGEDLEITIDYISDEQPINKKIHFSVVFRDIYEYTLFSCATRHVGFKVSNAYQNGTIKLIIKNLPLLPGIYLVDLYCKVDEIKSDYILGACQIIVQENDVYGTGIIPQKIKHGPFYVDYEWNHLTKQ